VNNQTNWGDLIGVLALFAVFVILPIIARLLKVKRYEVGSPFGEEPTPPAPTPEKETPSEFDRYIRMKKTMRGQKAPPAPEQIEKIEPVLILEEKPPHIGYEMLKKTEPALPLTHLVEDLPDAAQAIILAEIITHPRAFQPRPAAPFIISSKPIRKQTS
jgi:hypothetical protein